MNCVIEIIFELKIKNNLVNNLNLKFKKNAKFNEGI